MGKKVYLHIGMPKTGTSAIQEFMTLNNEELRKIGVSYPLKNDTGGYIKDYYLGAGNADRLFFSQNDINGKVHDFLDIVEEQAEDIIVLSAERISVYNVSENLKMISELVKSGIDLYIIVYLRNQYEYMESQYFELVKYDKTTDDFSSFINDAPNRRICDYRTTLSRFEECVTKEKMIVRLYEKSSFKNGNVIYDFMDILGIDAGSANFVFSSRKETNVSLTKRTAEIKRIINNSHFERGFIRDFFYESLISTSEIEKSKYGKESIFSKSEKDAFMDDYATINDYIAREYFGKEHLFNSTVENNHSIDHEEDIELVTSVLSKSMMQGYINLLVQNIGQEARIAQLEKYVLKSQIERNIDSIINCIESNKDRRICLYGYGNAGQILLKILEGRNISVDAIVDSNPNYNHPDSVPNRIAVDELPKYTDYLYIVATVISEKQDEIVSVLEAAEIHSYCLISTDEF